MGIHYPEQDNLEISKQLQNGKRLVCCVCADWCDNCDDWQVVFGELSESYPESCFVWINAEEHPDLVTEVDLEILPVLLVQEENDVMFLGTIRSTKEVAARLIELITPAMSADDPGIYEFLIDT